GGEPLAGPRPRGLPGGLGLLPGAAGRRETGAAFRPRLDCRRHVLLLAKTLEAGRGPRHSPRLRCVGYPGLPAHSNSGVRSRALPARTTWSQYLDLDRRRARRRFSPWLAHLLQTAQRPNGGAGPGVLRAAGLRSGRIAITHASPSGPR